MPKPSIQQLFGAGATVSGNKLTIDFADFSSVGWQTASGTTDAEKWLAAIVLRARAFYAANTDDVPSIAVDEPFPGLTTRNGSAKREYSYNVRIYEPDNGNAAPDPDNV